MPYRFLTLSFIVGAICGHLATDYFAANKKNETTEIASQPTDQIPQPPFQKIPAPTQQLKHSTKSNPLSATIKQARDEQLNNTVAVDIDGFWNAVGLGEVPAEDAVRNLVNLYVNRKFDDVEQIEAIVQATEFYDPAFIGVLLDTYINSSDDSVQQGIEDLVFLADNETVVTSIAGYGRSFDQDTRMAALSLLKGTDLSERPEIREMIYDVVDQESNPDILSAAIDTLAYVQKQPQQNVLTLERVERSLAHEDDQVRSTAISKLIELDRERKSQHLVNDALKDGAQSVQLATFQAIADNLYITDDIKRNLIELAVSDDRDSTVSSTANSLLVNYFSLSEADLLDLSEP